jgi:hypothetical protein
MAKEHFCGVDELCIVPTKFRQYITNGLGNGAGMGWDGWSLGSEMKNDFDLNDTFKPLK